MLDAVTLWFRGVLTDVQNRLSDVKANRGEKKLRSWAGRPPRTRSHSTEHHTQIVCGHFGDKRSRESNGLRHSGKRSEVWQTPLQVAIAKAPVESLVARSRRGPFAYVWTIEVLV